MVLRVRVIRDLAGAASVHAAQGGDGYVGAVSRRCECRLHGAQVCDCPRRRACCGTQAGRRSTKTQVPQGVVDRLKRNQSAIEAHWLWLKAGHNLEDAVQVVEVRCIHVEAAVPNERRGAGGRLQLDERVEWD